MKSYCSYCLAAVLLCIIQPAFGQTDSICIDAACCCLTDVAPAGLMYTHAHEKGHGMITYRFMHMGMSGLQSGNQTVNQSYVFTNYLSSPKTMSMDMHMLMFMYGLTDRFIIMGMINYNVNSMTMTMFSSTYNMAGMVMNSGSKQMNMNSSGLGDCHLNVLYNLLDTKKQHLLLIGGINLPTGSINRKGGSESMNPGQRFPYNMQQGSGTWDFIPGINYRFNTGSVTLGAQILGNIHTGLNQAGYRLGNSANFNIWGAWQWSRHFSTSLRTQMLISEPVYGYDASLYSLSQPAANPVNYGGRTLNGYAGLNYYFLKGILMNNRIAVESGLPFYQYLNGVQMQSQWTLFASWYYSF